MKPTYSKNMNSSDGVARRAQVINIFGASGSGKTTLASGLHYELKKQWIQAELAREAAKDMIHQETTHWFEQAVMMLAEQSSRIQFIVNKYDYVITDGPIMLASWDAPKYYHASFHQLCKDLYESYDNKNFFLYRTHAYDPNGRLETEEQASEIERNMTVWLDNLGIPYQSLYSSDDNANMLCDLLTLGTPMPPIDQRAKLQINQRIKTSIGENTSWTKTL